MTIVVVIVPLQFLESHCSSISPLHSKINDEKAQASITDQAAQYPNIAKITQGPEPRTFFWSLG